MELEVINCFFPDFGLQNTSSAALYCYSEAGGIIILILESVWLDRKLGVSVNNIFDPFP